MMWRLAVILTLLATLVLIAATGSGVRLLVKNDDQLTTDRIFGASFGFGRELESKIAAAEAVVQLLSAGDTGPGDSLLHQKALRSNAIAGVLVASLDDPSGGPVRGLPPFGASDRLALSAGQTLLKVAAPEKDRFAIYLIHTVERGDMPAVGYFELSPKWLWKEGQFAPDMVVSLAIVDGSERAIYKAQSLPSGLEKLAAHVALDGTAPGQITLTPNWRADGREWRAALSRVDFGGARMWGPPWNIVAFAPIHQLTPAFAAFGEKLPPLLVLVAIAVAAATLYLSRLWEPLLLTLQTALRRLQAGEFQPVPLGAAADTPRHLGEAFNCTVAALDERMRALTTLGEIDHLLLESAEIEQALEGVLARVCALTGCHAAAVALIDRDAAAYGRSFVAISNGMARPVCRVNIDPQMLEALAESPQGLTITRCELERHSFLEPLRDLGAESFWNWPVVAQGRVAAILSVGYLNQSSARSELAIYGSDCAARLATALRNSVRDEQLYRQAHFDSLTALPNRLLFRDRLSQELAATTDGSQRGALLYVDLDHFKKVNDSVGHLAGDQLLTIVAQRLRSCVKEGDTVARLGGDEFTVILRNVGAPEVAQDAGARIIDALQRPVNIAGRDHFVYASIGITLFPDDGNNIEDLMRNADLAMYRAKDGGRSRAVFFDSKLVHALSPIAESGLFRALRRREFSLHYQPQYALKDGSLVGLEALLRWQTPRDGMRYPKDFVPAAENSGLIIDIGAWVLESACNQLVSWREQGIAPPSLALNVSVQQLRTPDFTRLVRRTLEALSLPAQILELEITESVFAEEEARTNLKELAALGVRLALDDFGTGHSSLNFLRQHPVHSIKIDRSFMHEVPDSTQAAALAQTIINMAHALNKTVVAEGVETLEQLDFLREGGCDIAQGFVLAKPVSVIEVSELLSARRVADSGMLRRIAG